MKHEDRKSIGEIIIESNEDVLALYDALCCRVDPKGKSPWAGIVADVIFSEKPDKSNCKLLGSLLCHGLRDCTVENLELFFSELLQLKNTADEVPRRHAWAWVAYLHFKGETGRFPETRSELRKYMEARPEKYPDQPSPNGPWTRLWNESNLGTKLRA